MRPETHATLVADPFLRQVLHHNANTGLDVCKTLEPFSKSAALEGTLRNEALVLKVLKGVPGVAELLSFDTSKGQIIYRLPPGQSLASMGRPQELALGFRLGIARDVAATLVNVHRLGVIHRQISPATIHVGERGQTTLTDFEQAITQSYWETEFKPLDSVRGDLRFIAPEQTGRVAQPVDHRADLYALGGVLYHLLAGSPPFSADDALEVRYALLNRSPAPLESVAPDVPEPVSRVVTRLLTKRQEQRYQSAHGVYRDLEQCIAALEEPSLGAKIVIGRHDHRSVPSPPSRLFGRETEIRELRRALRNVADGERRLILVHGYSGVGKSALVRTLFPYVSAHDGFFASGKHDQYQRAQPLGALAEALSELADYLLMDDHALLSDLRGALVDNLGTNASLLTQLLPRWDDLLQISVPDTPVEADLRVVNRLKAAVLMVLEVLGRLKRPLVLFIDDLQWADTFTLELFESIASSDTGYLLLVGAYRDNEVDSTHPLSIVFSRLKGLSGRTDLPLACLKESDVASLLADVLDTEPEDIAGLVNAIFEKTQGNAFYTLQRLRVLFDAGHLRRSGLTWDCAPEALADMAASENIVALLLSELDTMDPGVKRRTGIASCLGPDFELQLLSQITGDSVPELVEGLLPVLQRSLLLWKEGRDKEEDKRLAFCHDRVRQAAYEVLTGSERELWHLTIARILLQRGGDPIVISDHYVRASGLVDTMDEAQQVAELLLVAARRVRAAGVYAKGLALLDAIAALQSRFPGLVTDQRAADLERHGNLFSLALYEEADKVFDCIVAAGLTLEDIKATALQSMSLSNRGNYARAVHLGLEVVAQLGLEVPTDDAWVDAVGREIDRLDAELAVGGSRRLLELEPCAREDMIGISLLLNRIVPAAFFYNPVIASWCFLRVVRIAQTHGYCPALPNALAMAILALVPARDDYVLGYELSSRALELLELHPDQEEGARTLHVFGLFGCHWREPVEHDIEFARKAYRRCVEVGDLEFACYTYFTTQAAILECATHLDEVAQEVEQALQVMEQTGNLHAEGSFVVFRQLVRLLRGETTQRDRFDDESFSEEAHADANQGNPMAAAFMAVYRALASALMSDWVESLNWSRRAEPLMVYITGFYPTALQRYVHGVSIAKRLGALGHDNALEEAARLQEELSPIQAWIQARAQEAPANFSHWAALLDALVADALDDFVASTAAFERAIDGAIRSARPYQHALACELAADAYASRGLHRASVAHRREALHGYQKWGASAKVTSLCQTYPDAVAESPSLMEQQLDLTTVVRAGQVMSLERDPAALVTRMIELVRQHATAELGRIYWLQGGAWVCYGGFDQDRVGLSLDGESHSACAGCELARTSDGLLLPASIASGGHVPCSAGEVPDEILRICSQGDSPLIVRDPTQQARFSRMAYIKEHGVRMLGGVPLFQGGTLRGLLYLESRQLEVFLTDPQVETLQLIGHQFATSFHNARLQQHLEAEVRARTDELDLANDRLSRVNMALRDMSELDALTGIANRRKLDAALAKEWRRSAREGSTLAAIMIDVDFFKRYNDRYGHALGDECLKTVAECLESQLQRPADLAARYGGEEFLVLLPNTGLSGAWSLAESIRKAIADLRIEHGDSEWGHVTLSAGIASIRPADASRFEELVKLADDALYAAKKQGRDCVVCAEPSRA